MAGCKGKPYGHIATVLFAALTAGVNLPAGAQTRFVPAPDRVVVPVSVQATAGAGSSLREAERAWRADPKRQDTAWRYAREVFVLGLREGDLRWYGAARAALQPWWDARQLPAEGHFMRALVRQGFHDFEGGIADLTATIAQEPQRAEAWSWRFSLYLLTSRLNEARTDCAELGQRFGAVEGQACQATLQYRTGQAAAAVPTFERLVQQPDLQGPLAQDWLRYHQGMALVAAGRPMQAAQVWQQHLQRHPGSHLVRLSLAETLNTAGQHAQALEASLATVQPTDALLVQALLAASALRDPRAADLENQVSQRMAAQAQRNEALIERPQMMFYIRHRADLPRGLALAVQSWTEQQEPADAALLIEAALASDRPADARPVLDWMRRTGYTDPVLASLARTLQTRLGR